MARFLTLILVTAAAGSLALTAQDLPDGEGKALIVERCTSCHGAESIFPLKLSREEWAPVVTRMLDYGAFLDDKEMAVTLDYLAKHFGPAAPAGASPAPAGAPAPSEADKTAQRHLDGICVTCHAADIIVSAKATKAGWVDILINMNGKGAGLSDADVDLLADYLARTYPAQETPP